MTATGQPDDNAKSATGAVTMLRHWRVIDTGLRSAAENIAINRAMLEAHQAGEIPNTLRFLQFRPAALVGFHQSVAQELREDFCAEHGIDIQRRITGGGAIYFDPTQIGWELYVDRGFLGTANMDQISQRICEAAAQGVSSLGVEARYRPRNDIEVNGKKISGTGGAFDGNSILYQGTLLIDFDVEKMLRVLRIPAEKLADKAIASARERVTNLKSLLGHVPPLHIVKNCLVDAFRSAFGISFQPTPSMVEAEQRRFSEALHEIDSPSWIYQRNTDLEQTPVIEGVYRCAGGTLRAQIHVDLEKQRIKQLMITGDFFVNPRRVIVDLEAALRNCAITRIDAVIADFFSSNPVDMLLLRADDFSKLIKNALEKVQLNDVQPA